METTQYFLGKQAYENGESLDDNPFDMYVDTDYWDDWQNGYMDAMADSESHYSCGCGLCDMSHMEYNPEAVKDYYNEQRIHQ